MTVRTKHLFYFACLAWAFGAYHPMVQTLADDANTLPGTQPLLMEGDIASQLVDGVDRFLLRQIEASADGRVRSACSWRSRPCSGR